jgi:Zn-dependent oligopeptidase
MHCVIPLQALLSLIDLQYHGAVLPADQGGSSSVWHQVAQQYSSIPPPLGTCPQARFSHLTIYGASYYSYLYARCISEALWNAHLAADPLDPQAGALRLTRLDALVSSGVSAGCLSQAKATAVTATGICNLNYTGLTAFQHPCSCFACTNIMAFDSLQAIT